MGIDYAREKIWDVLTGLARSEGSLVDRVSDELEVLVRPSREDFPEGSAREAF